MLEEALDVDDATLEEKGDRDPELCKSTDSTKSGGSRASFGLKHRTSEEDARSMFSSKSGNFQKAADYCNENVIVPDLDGKAVDIWLLTEIDHWNFEKERLVILTEKSLLVVKFDFIKLAICETKRVSLCSIRKIQIGDLTYPQSSLMQKRDCGGVRIHFGTDESLGLRQRWNPWCRDLPFWTFMHHPLIYQRGEADTIIYNIDHMIEAVKNALEIALRREGRNPEFTIDEGPILVESYAGISSFVFNHGRIGFFKERNPVNF